MADATRPGRNEVPQATKKNPSLQKHSWADKVRVSSSVNRFSLSKVHHELTGDIPKIVVPSELTATTSPKWERCLVGYFPCSPMPFHAVKEIATREWKKFGLENVLGSDGFFIFRFSDQDGLNGVLQLGPWMLGGKAIILQQWDPTFSFNKSKIKRVPVWVKLHDLPLPLWTEEGLSFVASVVGKPIACDKATHEGTRLAYARICIELDASRKPVRFFDLDTSLSSDPIRIKVEYEWKPKWCPSCLLFGHTCHSTAKETEQLAAIDNQGERVVSESLPENLPLPPSPPKEPDQIQIQNSNNPTSTQNSNNPTSDSKKSDKSVPFNFKRALSIPSGPVATNPTGNTSQKKEKPKLYYKAPLEPLYKRYLASCASSSLKPASLQSGTNKNDSSPAINWDDGLTDNLALAIPNLAGFEDSSDQDDLFEEMMSNGLWNDGDNTPLPLNYAKPSTPLSQTNCGLNTEASLGSSNSFEPLTLDTATDISEEFSDFCPITETKKREGKAKRLKKKRGAKA